MNDGAAFKIAKNFDLSVEPQEERSRGRCSCRGRIRTSRSAAGRPATTSPSREGTWVGAVDITPRAQG